MVQKYEVQSYVNQDLLLHSIFKQRRSIKNYCKITSEESLQFQKKKDTFNLSTKFQKEKW